MRLSISRCNDALHFPSPRGNAVCDAASVHCSPTIRRIYTLIINYTVCFDPNFTDNVIFLLLLYLPPRPAYLPAFVGRFSDESSWFTFSFLPPLIPEQKPWVSGTDLKRRMSFLHAPSQHCQSTEEKSKAMTIQLVLWSRAIFKQHRTPSGQERTLQQHVKNTIQSVYAPYVDLNSRLQYLQLLRLQIASTLFTDSRDVIAIES